MQKVSILIISLMLASSAWAEHHEGDHMKGESKDSVKYIVYKADTKESNIMWSGSKKFVDSAHTGTVNLKSGQIFFHNDKPVKGEFVVDMTSLTNSDLESDEYKKKLEGHLKSEDFFKVEDYKTASFTFNKVKDLGEGKYEFTGEMEIRGVKKPKTITAKLNKNGNLVTTETKIKIDRTDYGVEYNSEQSGGNFFTRLFKGGKDKIIKNDMEVNVKLVAKKG